MEQSFYRKEAEHERNWDGQMIRYRTICEDLPVKDETGALLGTVFAYEYLKQEPEVHRPVLFAWNGGPGASAVWLHAGFLAPVRFQVKDLDHPEFTGEAPMEENPCWLLSQTDIVILDPPGTGYGTIADPAYKEKLCGYHQDAEVMAQVVERWLVEHGRLHDPIYLLGESYGTVRSVLVADILAGGPFLPGMASKAIQVSGLILMGSAINYAPWMYYLFGEKNVSATALALPTMAALHWYHKTEKTQTLEECVQNAYEFASDRYVRAAYLGKRLPEEERGEVIRELSGLTGLSEGYLRNHNLNIEPSEFQKKLLEEDGKILSAYDGRMTLPYTDGKLDAYADDAVLGPYGFVARSAFDTICKEELQMDLKRPFTSVDFKLNGAWDYKCTATPFESLSRCLRRDGSLRVLFLNGVYDMTTMIGQAAYAAAQIQTARPGQVQVKEYPSGHMAYIGAESAEKLGQDLREFIV